MFPSSASIAEIHNRRMVKVHKRFATIAHNLSKSYMPMSIGSFPHTGHQPADGGDDGANLGGRARLCVSVPRVFSLHQTLKTTKNAARHLGRE
ncbi:hypothetical protein SB748_25000 [Rhizobium sp. SIMBA_035]